MDGFENYDLKTNATPIGFVVFVSIFVVLSIGLSAPCISCWDRYRLNAKERQSHQQQGTIGTADLGSNEDTGDPGIPSGSPLTIEHEGNESNHDNFRNPTPVDSHDFHSFSKFENERAKLNDDEDNNGAATVEQYCQKSRYGDLELRKTENSQAHSSSSLRSNSHINEEKQERKVQPHYNVQRLDENDGNIYVNAAERLSCVQNEATTTILRDELRKGSVSISSRRSIRTSNLQRSVVKERQYVSKFLVPDLADDESCTSDKHSSRIQGSESYNQETGSVLRGDMTERESDYYRRKLMKRCPSDNSSFMTPFPADELTPDDAASQGLGRSGMPHKYEVYLARLERDRQEQLILDPETSKLSAILLNVADLTLIDHELKRLLKLAFPSTIGAVADPLYRLILVALISRFVSTNAMVAYLTVNVVVRLTTEQLSAAISDAESSLLQEALMEENESRKEYAGQIMQLAIIMQCLLVLPVLVIWIFQMDVAVFWLVNNRDIANLAISYTQVIFLEYTLRDASKALMLPFYISGQAQFESTVDSVAAIMTILTILIVASQDPNGLLLTDVGWIQVAIGIAKFVTKALFLFFKGMLRPYIKGLFGGFCLKDTTTVTIFLVQVVPQFLGSLVELSEWEVLILIVRNLGGAEVTAWAIMGLIWEIFVAFSYGLGEAAAVRILFYLKEGLPLDAKYLAKRVACLAILMILLVTSFALMLGPRSAVFLTSDSTIQHLLSNLVGVTCLANASMTVAQICWSISDAQGRSEFASATILVCRWFLILPFASLVVFKFMYDPVAVAAVIALGYGVACFGLTYQMYRSDWVYFSRSQQCNEQPISLEIADIVENEDEASGSEPVDDSDYSSSIYESTVISRQVV